jgi:hypothetical protein
MNHMLYSIDFYSMTHAPFLGSETSSLLFLVASSRSNTKVSLGTNEREGSHISSCQEPPAGKVLLSLLLTCMLFTGFNTDDKRIYM